MPPYVKQVWENLPATTTPTSAERFNHMEDGIDAVSTEVVAHAGVPHAHPDLAGHDALGLATQVELNAHAATSHGQAEITAHVAAVDPHAGYRLESVAITAADVAADVATQAELDAHAATVHGGGNAFGFPYTIDPRFPNTSVGGIANGARFYRVVGAATITKIGCVITSSGGSMCLGSYNTTGSARTASPNVRRVTTGSIVTPAAGYVEFTVPSTVVAEGDYFAISTDNTTVQFSAGGASGSSFAGVIGTLNRNQSTGGHPLPDPAAPTGTALVGQVICIIGVP